MEHDAFNDFSDQAPSGRRAHFVFQNLPPSAHLIYQLLSWENHSILLDLFAEDTHAFVDARFKTAETLREYVAYQMDYAAYSAKRGGCDWFFLYQGQYAGIIHLYDLSVETTDNRHRRCTIGFATSAPFRRQRLTSEAVRHLLAHVFTHFHMQEVMAYRHRENIASGLFLEKLGFENRDEVHKPDDLYHYYTLQREAFAPPRPT